MEGRNPEGKTPTNPEDTAANTTNTEIKLLTTGDREVDKKLMEPCDASDCAA